MNSFPATLNRKILIVLVFYILFISAIDIFQDKFTGGYLLINLIFLLFVVACILRYSAGKAAITQEGIGRAKLLRIIFYAYCAYAIFSNAIKYATAQYDFPVLSG